MAYTTIDKPSKYFNTKLYTGDGTGAKAITGVGFQPDLVWLKTRSTAFHHQLHDRVRGATAGAIYSSLTNAQDSNYPITSFDSDGFTLGNSASLIADSFGSQNGSGTTMCSWNWLANNTSGSSNTSGTITSTVSANTTSGFSIVSYTGTGGIPVTVGHGLGVTPEVLIIKNRTNAYNWAVYHKELGNTGGLFLNTTSAFTTDADLFNNTSPTSSVVTFSNSTLTNQGSANHIMYAFNSIKGFSKFGKYTGNGSSDGTFVYTGFKPAFVMIKQTNASGEHWTIRDNKRQSYNLELKTLFANLSNAENTGSTYGVDLLSNGFKCRDADVACNSSGSSYIYMAFSENPFVSSKGIPTTAR